MNTIVDLHAGQDRSSWAQPWRQALVALTLLVVWVLFLYRDTGIAMVTIWARSETFTHAFLVPPISLWLIWRQRAVIATHSPQASLWVLISTACAAILWLLGDLVAVNSVTQLALIALLILTVPAVLGLSITRLIMFPLGFLFFAVPVGEFVMPQLMEWTANFTVLALRLSGIPVYREGLQFVIPSGSWSVVEACSGVRYLIASLTVGTLFAYLNYQSTRRRILFVIVSILVPVVANWMRAYMIVMLGHLSGNKLAVGVDHLIYGWVFFGIVIMLMFILGARWAEPETVVSKNALEAVVQHPSVSAAMLWTTTVCFAVLAALPHVALLATERGGGAELAPLSAPRALSSGWQAASPDGAGFKPAFQNSSGEINNSYANGGRVVGLYLGYYRHQNYVRKLVSSSNVLVASNDTQWAQVDNASRVVTMGGKSVAVRTAELRGRALMDQANAGGLVVWQIYWVNGMITESDYLAKIFGAIYRLMGRGDDSAVIVVYTSKDQAGRAEDVLESFLSANYSAIDELLRKTQRNGF